jgi:hypothetical protein
MISLRAQFSQRDNHRMGIIVDQDGMKVEFSPACCGVVGAWSPEEDTAAVFIELAEEHLASREFTGGKIDEGAMGESYITFKNNGSLTKIHYVCPGGEWFSAQVVDEELRNLLDALRIYFGLPPKVGVLERGRDW